MLRAYRAVRDKRRKKEAEWTEVVQSVRTLRDDVHEVKLETKTNHGSSLKDAVRFLQEELAVERVARRSMTKFATYDIRVDRETGEFLDLHVSAAYRALTGLDAHEAANGGWLRSVHPKDRDRVADQARIAVASSTAFITQYTLRNVLDKQEVDVEHRGQPVRLAGNGPVVGWVGLIVPSKQATELGWKDVI